MNEDVLPRGFEFQRMLSGHQAEIHQIAWSPDGRFLASGSRDNSIRVWDFESGNSLHELRRHGESVYALAWSWDGSLLASASRDKSIGIWDMTQGELRLRLTGHGQSVYSVAWSPDGGTLFSGSRDRTVRIWDIRSGTCGEILNNHADRVWTVACSANGDGLASGSSDCTIQLWRSPNPLHAKWKPDSSKTLKGHTDRVNSVTWSKDGYSIASASNDSTIRIWDAHSGLQTHTLEGHTGAVSCVSFSPDCSLLASKSTDASVRIWRCDIWETVAILQESVAANNFAGLAFNPHYPFLATLGRRDTVIRIWRLDVDSLLGLSPAASSVHYVNAKVVLVGDSGVGKSGLGIRIAEGQFRPTESTHGAQFWQIPLPPHVAQQISEESPVEAELTLWDLAGQPEYRLTHQLFLDDVDATLLLFDGSDPVEPFRGVAYWSKVLKKHAPQHGLRFLVSARCDVSSVTVDQREINKLIGEFGFDAHARTSAKTGEGVPELAQLLLDRIEWSKLSRTTTPKLFQMIKEWLLQKKASSETLVSLGDINEAVRQQSFTGTPTQAEVDTVIRLLQARGLVYRISPTPKVVLVLLRPELINQYASSVIQAARRHERGIGAVPERDVLTSNIPLSGFERLEAPEEKIVLESTVELLIQHDLCFREMGLLVFPSQINLTRPTLQEDHPRTEVTYQFSGSIETIYASLVVRLGYTEYFHIRDLWKYAAEFTRVGHRLGFALHQIQEGSGELEIYFYPEVNEFDRVTFIRFITDHLCTKGVDIQEHIRLYCSQCDREIIDREAIEARVKAGKLDVPCQYCGTFVIIPHSIEERYASDRAFIVKQEELEATVEKRTVTEVHEFHSDRRQYTKPDDKNIIHILHISDLHVGSAAEARKYRMQLESDLIRELSVGRLEHLVFAGDAANYSTQSEYEAAFELIDGLVKRFGLDPSRVVVVPGNHDLSWDLSARAYTYVPQHRLPKELPLHWIPMGDAGALQPDENLHRQRFAYYSSYFHKRIYGGLDYPTDYEEQGILNLHSDSRIAFLALNSTWQIDHYFRNLSGINMQALSRALDQLQNPEYDDWLKCAVWHHPITGKEMMNDDFLQLLAVHNFQLVMHGHVHEAQQGLYSYDSKRALHVVGAGTFGTPVNERMLGIPLNYNLLALNKETKEIVVYTRKKEKPDGAWSADARWGDKNNPKPYYTIQLR